MTSKNLPKLIIGYGCLLALFGIVRNSIRPSAGHLSLIVGISGGLLALICGVIALSKRSRNILIILGLGIIGFSLLGQNSDGEVGPNDLSRGELVASLVLGIVAGLCLGTGGVAPSNPPKGKNIPENPHMWN